MDEQEGKQWCDHVVECADSGDDVVVLDVSVWTDGELAVGHVDFGLGGDGAVLDEV